MSVLKVQAIFVSFLSLTQASQSASIDNGALVGCYRKLSRFQSAGRPFTSVGQNPASIVLSAERKGKEGFYLIRHGKGGDRKFFFEMDTTPSEEGTIFRLRAGKKPALTNVTLHGIPPSADRPFERLLSVNRNGGLDDLEVRSRVGRIEDSALDNEYIRRDLEKRIQSMDQTFRQVISDYAAEKKAMNEDIDRYRIEKTKLFLAKLQGYENVADSRLDDGQIHIFYDDPEAYISRNRKLRNNASLGKRALDFVKNQGWRPKPPRRQQYISAIGTGSPCRDVPGINIIADKEIDELHQIQDPDPMVRTSSGSQESSGAMRGR